MYYSIVYNINTVINYLCFSIRHVLQKIITECLRVFIKPERNDKQQLNKYIPSPYSSASQTRAFHLILTAFSISILYSIINLVFFWYSHYTLTIFSISI